MLSAPVARLGTPSTTAVTSLSTEGRPVAVKLWPAPDLRVRPFTPNPGIFGGADIARPDLVVYGIEVLDKYSTVPDFGLSYELRCALSGR